MTAATAVRERGITFSAPMVRALRREVDPKGQTRRIIKPQPEQNGAAGGTVLREGFRHGEHDSERYNADLNPYFIWRHPKLNCGYCHTDREAMRRLMLPLCPYGKPGDRLYVREAWRFPKEFDHLPPREVDEAAAIFTIADGDWGWDCDGKSPWGRYRNARFMPRWASRITREITEVRAQKLQDISEKDARAEGISVLPLQSPDDPSAWWQSSPGVHQDRTARGSFIQLWDSIHGDEHPFASNPWVWALTFRQVQR